MATRVQMRYVCGNHNNSRFHQMTVLALAVLLMRAIQFARGAHVDNANCGAPDSWLPDPLTHTPYQNCFANGVQGSCTCLCHRGWAGDQRYDKLFAIDGTNPTQYGYASFGDSDNRWKFHCTVNIREGYCSSHGYSERELLTDPASQRYRDYETYNVRCQCDNNYVGILSSSPFRQNDDSYDSRIDTQCMFNIDTDICSGHGTWPSASTTKLMSDQLSMVTCVCHPDWMTVPVANTHPKRYQCNVKKPCPIISGKTCGLHGTCGADKPRCTCDTGYGGTYCCPRSPQTANGAVCGGRGTCGSNGNCVCNAGFGGTFCCPKVAGQTKECGQYGTCLQNGQCSCASGFGGSACQVNLQCPTNDLVTPKSCSGWGTCTPQYGGEALIERLGFLNEAGVSVTITGTPFADEGVVNLIRRFQQYFLFKTAAQADAYVKTHVSVANLCTTALNRTACFKTLLEVHFAPLLSPLPNSFTDALVYSHQVVHIAFPWLDDVDVTYLKAAAALVGTTGTSTTARVARARGIAALLAYELLRTPITGKITFPTFPVSFCNCTIPKITAVVGVSWWKSAADCGASCLVGNDRMVCSGFKHGVMRGMCDSKSQTCVCGTRFTGKACQTSLTGLCFPNNDPSAIVACTATSHGTCKPFTDPDTSQSSNKCFCAGNWIGQYCEYSKCTPTNLADATRRIECSNRGLCRSTGICACDVAGQLSLKDTLLDQPFLPVGRYCEINAIAQCGTSTNIGGGKVKWEECNGRGKCQTNLANPQQAPFCQCDPGAFGDQCEFSNCATACTGNTVCDTNVGECVCKDLWHSPTGCDSIDDGDCFCSLHDCVHGEPAYVNGSSIGFCDCDEHFDLDSNGKCTKLQCPLVVLTNQGERACTPDDHLCPNLSPTTQTKTLSKTTGCCFNACGTSCRYNSTSETVRCLCSPALAFTQKDGICYSKCHGQPFAIQGSHLICDCSALISTLLPGQFVVPATCEIHTCLNEGVPNGAGGCTCPVTWSGQFCEISNCGSRGTFNELTSRCECMPPFAPALLGSLLCNGDACLTGEPVLVNASDPLPYRCACPNDTLIGPDQLSCIELDCEAEDQQDACAACLNGGTPYIDDHRIQCDCTTTGFIGETCDVIDCHRFGTPFVNQTGCDCKFPFVGVRCEHHDCGEGFATNLDPLTEDEEVTCVCVAGYNGDRCSNFTGEFGERSVESFIISYNETDYSFITSSSSSSSGAAGNESSSSTAPATAAATTSTSGLTTAEKVGIGVGITGGAFIIAAAVAWSAQASGYAVVSSSSAAVASAAGTSSSSAVQMSSLGRTATGAKQTFRYQPLPRRDYSI